MKLQLQIPLTARQQRDHWEEVLLLGGCKHGVLKLTIELEQLTTRACQEVLDTIMAGRLIAGTGDEPPTLIEETLRDLKKALEKL